jgi:hypothetical protein
MLTYATSADVCCSISVVGFRGAFGDICRRYASTHNTGVLATLQTALESDFWRPYPTRAGAFDLASIQVYICIY